MSLPVVACVCGCLTPTVDPDRLTADRARLGGYAAMEPGVCTCGHSLYLHYGDRTINE